MSISSSFTSSIMLKSGAVSTISSGEISKGSLSSLLSVNSRICLSNNALPAPHISPSLKQEINPS